MPRKLKVYQTSIGFFDLAIAAPSMKAALEAWGSGSNLFHQGFAQETDDPKIATAAMAKPGVVLRRPVGTNETFNEDSDLPANFDLNKPAKRATKPAKPPAKSKKKGAPTKVDDKAAKNAAVAYEKEQRKREVEQKKWEAAEAKNRKLREAKVEKAQSALDRARGEHEAKAGALAKERAGLDDRIQAEESRWSELQDRLKGDLRRAGGQN